MLGFHLLAMDQFANKLWEEETYYLNMISTPHLWSEKKRIYMAAINRHLKSKKITLKNVTSSRTILHHSSSTTNSTTTTITTTTSSVQSLISIIESNSNTDMDFNLEVSPFARLTPAADFSCPSPIIPLPIDNVIVVEATTVHPFFTPQTSSAIATSSLSSFKLAPQLDIPADQQCKCGQKHINK